MSESKKKIKIPIESDADEKRTETEEAVEERADKSTEADAVEAQEPENAEEPVGENVDYLDQLQRLQAEFTNFRKRTEKEKENLANFVRGNFIQSLLPVMDDLDLMIQHHQKDKAIPFDGIELIVQKFHKVLTDQGLETVEALGEVFNPEMHEALAVEETDEADADDIIIEEWQKGYKFHEQLIRPSRVKVNRYVEPAEDDKS